MAGLCAAASAVEAGARPLVIEKGAEPGGSMLMSGGTIWTAPTMAVMERWVPGGDRTRQRRLVDGLAPGLRWLDSLGVTRTSAIDSDRQTGAEVDTAQLTARLIAAIEAGGGRVRTESALASIAVDRDGLLSAAVVDGGGVRTTIRARSVVIATGGFGGNAELLARHMGPSAHSMLAAREPTKHR